MMNYNQPQHTNTSSNTNSRRQKTVPLNPPNTMNPNPSYNTNHHSHSHNPHQHQPQYQTNHSHNNTNSNPYNMSSPRGTKSPRSNKRKKSSMKSPTKSKSKKDKRNKSNMLNNNSNMNTNNISNNNNNNNRPRAKTAGHSMNNNNHNNHNHNNMNPSNSPRHHNNNNNVVNNMNPRNNPHGLYMSTTQQIPPPPHRNNTGNNLNNINNINNINNNNNSMNNGYVNTHKAWNGPNTASNGQRSHSHNDQQKRYDTMNSHQAPNVNNNPLPSPRRDNIIQHNATGTMVQHINQNTNGHVDNLYDNTIPHSTSPHVYQSRLECVWSIKLFQQQDVASNFSCQTCCDIPKIEYAYTCDKELIYCEYCIDLKLRQGIDIKQKKRMPMMVQNMINELKIKCPNYHQCKYRGTVRNLSDHEKSCKNKMKKTGSGKAKECPLKTIGCNAFKGGYLDKHYVEYQQQHLDFIINYFDNKFRKFENNYSSKLNAADIEIKNLQKENHDLKLQIQSLITAKDEISRELTSITNQIQNHQLLNSQTNSNAVNNNNTGYKIVVNTPPPSNGNNANNNNNEQKQQSMIDQTDRNNDNDNSSGDIQPAPSDGNWSSFINAHRRLSTKTGTVAPESDDQSSINHHLSHKPSMNTQQSSNEDSKQMELPTSDQKMVVLDIGSQLCKVGTAGSNKPAVIFQSMVAKNKINGSRAIGSLNPSGATNNTKTKLSNYQCSYPIERGIIKNYDDYESIIDSIFYDKLVINPCDYNALMIEPILSPKTQSCKIAEICFEKFNLNALFLAQDALCALYASGGNTGLSISSGHGITSVVPIYEGYVLPHAAQKLDCAGSDISNFLKDKLNLNGLFRSKLSENKFADSLKQKLAYVAQNYQMEKQHTMFERIVYRLPDGSEIEVGQERFQCTETLFSKDMNHTNITISDLVKKALSKSQKEIRQVLFENIVCSGGNTMLKGFDDRLKKEIDANAPENSGWKTRVFGLVDRKLSCWIGGSIMASLSHMDQLWMTNQQYQEMGPSLIAQRTMGSY